MSCSNGRTGDEVARQQLKTIVERIARAMARRERLAARGIYQTPVASAKGYSERQIYRQTRSLLRRRMLDAAKAAWEAEWRGAPPGSIDNPFAALIYAVMVARGQTEKKYMNRARILARALLYAHRQNVPVRYLIGFIHQIGGLKGMERMRPCQSGTVQRRAFPTRPKPRPKRQKRTGRRAKTPIRATSRNARIRPR